MSDHDPVEVIVVGRAGAADVVQETLSDGDGLTIDAGDLDEVIVETRPEDDKEIKADGGVDRFGWSDERWEREVREKKRRGQDSLDKSQTVREAAQLLVTTLRACRRSDHCHRLAAFIEDRLARPQLDYEDLMYPCRCHRDDGLILRVEDETQTNWLQYGAGDLFYWMTDDERTMQSAIDMDKLWRAFRVYQIDVTPVLDDDTPFREDDDD